MNINDFIEVGGLIGQIKLIDGDEITYMDDEHTFYYTFEQHPFELAERPDYWTEALDFVRVI
jgi:hypothetical protein